MTKAIALLKFEITRLRGNLAAKKTGYEADKDTAATIKEYEAAVVRLSQPEKKA